MIRLEVTHRCRCVGKIGNRISQDFTKREKAYIEGLRLADELNATSCGRHTFKLMDDANHYKIDITEGAECGTKKL